jgi:transcriptional regulator with AAA-type ATPase domain
MSKATVAKGGRSLTVVKRGVAAPKRAAPKPSSRASGRRDNKAKPAAAVRSDHSATTATQIADVLRGQAAVGMPGWLNGEAAYAWFVSNGVVRQMIGRFAMLMTKPDHKYTHSDVRDFDWAPTISQLDDMKYKFACRMAATWAFVFGAGIIEHVVDDADRDAAGEPLELAYVRAYKGVRIHTAYSLRPEHGRDWKTAEWFEVQRVGVQRKIHRSRLSIMVANDTPDGIVMVSRNSGWPPSWMEGIYQAFTEWSNVECDVSAIIRTLSILHLQLHDWAVAADNPDSEQAAAVDARMAQALETLSAHGILITDKKDALGEVSRNVSGLDKLIEAKALRAAASAGVPKELLRMEAEGNLGDNSAPIDAYYDLVGGWAEQMAVPAITDASEISLAAQRYKAKLAGETLIVPAQFIVKQDPIQQANGKEKAEQRKANADARALDAAKTGVPLEVILQDPELRENYPGIDAYYEAKATREQVAQKKAVEAGLDNPEGEDMVSAAQAAKPFNISAGTLIKMAKAGKVPGRQIVGRWKFYLSQVQAALMGKSPAQLEAAADERLDDLGLSESTTFGETWGESDAMREIFAVLERIRDSRLSVLLLGETGTGKEAIARGLHVGDGPFVTINAAELDNDPSDAAKQLRKALAAAVGGTLFLDEVGDTPHDSQSALLRIMASEHSARIVSATSRPAEWLRPDLYYRLAEIEVEIPPLRDRESDVIEIARRMYAKYTAERGYEAADPPFTDATLATMLIYPWPGNCRELKSAVSRGVELAPRATPIGVEHMQLNIRGER